MKVPILDLKRQYESIRGEIEPKVLRFLESGAYIMGEGVASAERELAAFLGVKHAVAVGNGTDALTIALSAAGVKAGDEVITTPFTFFATAEAVASLGAKPVFADIRAETLNLDPGCIEEKITPRTKAILPVHIFGQPAQMDEINAIAQKHGLTVIEDACQAIGAEYKGRKVGGLGALGCFSFFPTKNLGAFGDAGMITTDDDALAVICRALREHGGGRAGAEAKSLLEGKTERFDDMQADPMYNPYKYFNYLVGYNSRMDAMQAVILRVKLAHLNEWNRLRAEHAQYYLERLAGTGVILPKVGKGMRPVWHQFAVRTEYKQELGDFLREKGIASGVFYPVPLHLQKAFEGLGCHEGDLPVAEMVTRQSLCLPIFPELTQPELDYAADSIIEFYSRLS
ncbi:MAG: DegT/DnrJ/EryC1/StrS family aminotransferase [Clostridia bacterium]|nr:DegT/DnrJ/EryC1/StrS family aminotransferase [Clostridia bacterium]